MVDDVTADDNLVWIDLEMTGLDTANDHIIEIATIVTDAELHILAEGPVIAVHQPDGVLERMERLTTGFESLLEGGDTQFAPDAPDPRAIAEIMTGVFIGMVHNWRLTPGYPLEERLTEAAKWICVMLRRSPQG